MATVGADPEVFIMDGFGRPEAACGRLGGTKGKPRILDAAFDIGVQEDNVTAELTWSPSTDAQAFERKANQARQLLGELVRTEFSAQHRMLFADELVFPETRLQHPGAMEFGCSPDFDGYTEGDPTPPVDAGMLGGVRYAGGHIHIGYDTHARIPGYVAALFADLFIGRWCRDMFPATTRREVYGAPGRFRPTPYGIEYRTPGPSWLEYDDTCNDIAFRALSLGRMLENESEGALQLAFATIPWGAVRSYMKGNHTVMNEINDAVRQTVVWRYL